MLTGSKTFVPKKFNKDCQPDLHGQKTIQPTIRHLGREQAAYVWYACYGSNMAEERFMYYLQGGRCKYNGKEYDGCRDKSAPKAKKAITIPFEMYYGNCSRNWNNCGVSFLDSSRSGKTLGRMYLISKEQFEEVRRQEGPGDCWYNQVIYLGKDSGYEIYTFTNKTRRKENEPDAGYISVIRQGLIETYPQITEKELKEYLATGN
ncbi:MAG: hypothetical protein QME45_11935 [Clostridiales bacterium]|nr:hypothetical protein [Clostridiales bacterium]HBM80591.1 hypothetical protein [Clostridiaceae bacterium]